MTWTSIGCTIRRLDLYMAETRSETVAREIVRALNEHEKDKQIKKQLLEMLRVVNERLEDPGIDAFLGKAEGRS